jgi:hypothetical protein
MRAWWIALLLATALGCAARSTPPPPAEPESGPVAVTVEPMVVSWRDEPARAAEHAPSEPGFTFCCGDGRYKLEIDCSDMLKRCYERRDGGWAATYGRHCKTSLGEACYLDDCDARCL